MPPNTTRVELAHLLQEELDQLQESVHDDQEFELVENDLECVKEMDFSDGTLTQLEKLGIRLGRLVFRQKGVTELIKHSEDNDTGLSLLATQVKNVLSHVPMQRELGHHMIVHNILTTVASIGVARRSLHHGVIILDHLKLTSDHGTVLSNPASDYQLKVAGEVDYVLVRYQGTEKSCTRASLMDSSVRAEYVLSRNGGKFFVVQYQRKRGESCSEMDLPSLLAGATLRALVWCELAKSDHAHFCLTNGLAWIFVLYKVLPDGTRACYNSEAYQVSWEESETLRSLRTIVVLLLCWFDEHPVAPNASEGLIHVH